MSLLTVLQDGKWGADDFQTPPEALDPLLPYIPEDSLVWECACGNKNLVKGLHNAGFPVIASDILTGQDFLTWEPDFPYELILTNPPYSLKNEFLERCYSLGKPFALLMPLTALESKKRQSLYREHGLELIILPKRIAFETPSGCKSSPWFSVAWFTYGLDIGRDLTFS